MNGAPAVLILLLAALAAVVAFFADLLVLVGEFLQFIVGEMLDVDHLVVCLVDGLDDLVELQVDGAGVAVLRVLDQEDHEEGDDGGAGVDDELPSVRIVEVRARDKPQGDYQQRGEECPLRADHVGGQRGKDVKAFLLVGPISSHAPHYREIIHGTVARNMGRY